MSRSLAKRQDTIRVLAVSCTKCQRRTGVDEDDVPEGCDPAMPFKIKCTNPACREELTVALQHSNDAAPGTAASAREQPAIETKQVLVPKEVVACVIIGYWKGDNSERFGLQLTAPSLPNSVYGGWTYLGEYASNDREGLGEVAFAFTQCDRRWVMEEGGRIVGFWSGDMLQGPAWKIHPGQSRHYRGTRAAVEVGTEDQPCALTVSLVWFKRKQNRRRFFDSESMGELEEEILLEPCALVAPADVPSSTKVGGSAGAAASGSLNSEPDPEFQAAERKLSDIHAHVAQCCQKLHCTQVPTPSAIPEAERRFREFGTLLACAMVDVLSIPLVTSHHSSLCQKFARFVLDGYAKRRGASSGAVAAEPDGQRAVPASSTIDYFAPARSKVEALGRTVGVLQTKTIEVTSESRSRGKVTRHITTM